MLTDTPIANATPSQRLQHIADKARRERFFKRHAVIRPPTVAAEIQKTVALAPIGTEVEIVVTDKPVHITYEKVTVRRPYPLIATIQKACCKYYNITMKDMVGPIRSWNFVRPRQIAMYLSRELTPNSFPEIGRRFGGRDHTTSLHGWRKVKELMGESAEIAAQVAELAALLSPPPTEEVSDVVE